MTIGDLLDTARLIIQSDPSRLGDFAERWARVAGAASAQEPVVARSIQDVESRSQGRTAQQLTPYRLQTSDGLNKLGAGALEVSNALQAIAPRLATIRKDLMLVLVGAGASVLALGIPLVGPAVTGLAGGAEVLAIVNLVNTYNTEMVALQTALLSAGAKMEVLDSLHAAGGVLPRPPAITPG